MTLGDSKELHCCKCQSFEKGREASHLQRFYYFKYTSWRLHTYIYCEQLGVCVFIYHNGHLQWLLFLRFIFVSFLWAVLWFCTMCFDIIRTSMSFINIFVVCIVNFFIIHDKNVNIIFGHIFIFYEGPKQDKCSNVSGEHDRVHHTLTLCPHCQFNDIWIYLYIWNIQIYR